MDIRHKPLATLKGTYMIVKSTTLFNNTNHKKTSVETEIFDILDFSLVHHSYINSELYSY